MGVELAVLLIYFVSNHDCTEITGNGIHLHIQYVLCHLHLGYAPLPLSIYPLPHLSFSHLIKKNQKNLKHEKCHHRLIKLHLYIYIYYIDFAKSIVHSRLI